MNKTTLFILTLIAFHISGCTKKDEPKTKATFRVGLVLDKGGRDDKSFNTAALKGASQAVKDLGIELKDVESPNDTSFEPSMRVLAEKGYSLILGIGFSQKDALTKVARQFPNTKFAIVDAPVDAVNVQSIMFAEHEGSFMVGYLAGLATQTGSIGFIGGMEVPLIKRFQLGFEAGIKEAKPDAKIIVNYIGNTSDAWANPARGKELALAQFGKKVDIIFAPAGASAMGVFDAAEEKNLYAIGVDSNQNWIKPGRIITSMLKRVDEAVYNVIKDAVANNFKPGVRTFGLLDKGVDYSLDSHNEKLVAPFKDKLEARRQDILSGKIKVPDYYEMQKSELKK